MARFNYLLLCVSLVAGLPDEGSRIINGDRAQLGQFPWQARVSGTGISCGGVILSPQWILTIALCLNGTTNLQVHTGQVQLNLGITSEAEGIIIHQYYNPVNRQNDIGLIKLSTALTFNAYTKAVALTEEYLERGSEVVVSGWGQTTDDTNPANYLSYYYGKTISNLECGNIFGHSNIYADTVCVVSATETVHNICVGDVGGPLVMNSQTTPILVGLGIFYAANPACENTNPSGFLRTEPYVGWIRSNAGI